MTYNSTIQWIIFGLTIASYFQSFLPIFSSDLQNQISTGLVAFNSSAVSAAVNNLPSGFSWVLNIFIANIYLLPSYAWALGIRVAIGIANYLLALLSGNGSNLLLISASIAIWLGISALLNSINTLSLSNVNWQPPWNYLISLGIVIGVAWLGQIGLIGFNLWV